MAKLVLCKGVELEPDYAHTFDFPSLTIQRAYFASKAYKTYDSFLQIKDRNTSLFKGIIAKENYDYVKVPEYIDNVRECTYLYWDNDSNSKRYFAFITNSYYLNEETSIVEYELDVMQTFLFDYKIEGAHIAREHQNRFKINPSLSYYDRIFNIQPENLNLGKDYIINGNQKFCKKVTIDNKQYDLVWIIIVATEALFGNETKSYYLMNNNLYVYCIPYVIGVPVGATTNVAPVKFYYNGTAHSLWNYKTISEFFTSEEAKQKVYQITVSSFLPRYDKLTLNGTTITEDTTEGSLYKYIEYTYQGTLTYGIIQLFQNGSLTNIDDSVLGTIGKDLTLTFSPTTTLTPEMKYESKLLTDPYSFMQFTHNNQSINLKYENVFDKTIMGKINLYGLYSFMVYNKKYATMTPSGFEDDDLGYMYGLASKPINDLPWTSDAYLNYMLTKSAQAITGMAVKTAGGAVGIGAGIAMTVAGFASENPALAIAGISSIAGGTVSAGGAVAEEIAKREDLKNVPESLNSLSNDGTFSISSKTLIPIIQYLEIRPEYKNQIYNYFRLYGYKSNRTAYPDGVDDGMMLKSRYYYNYIKCSDINIELGFNRDFHDKIISIFKNGVTFWHFRTGMTYANFKPFNYTYENIEVSVLPSN